MKVCPFCREEIQDEAIKCRYCASSLLPPQGAAQGPASASAPADNRVTYILDQDLIRFGKFALAMLAIFTVVGLYLYGIDVKQLAKDADGSRKEAEASQKLASSTQAEIQKTKDAVAKDRTDLERQLSEAQAALALAQTRLQSVETIEKHTHDMQAEIEVARQGVNSGQQRVKEYLDSIQKDVATAHSMVTGAPAPPVVTNETSVVYSVRELAALYDIPTEFDGKGQAIGLIELGGGYTDSDVASYFEGLHLPKPKITSVSINGGANKPGSGPDSQVLLDIEVAGAVAPAAEIVVYFAPNTNQGFLEAIRSAIADRSHEISVLSISWGSRESEWTPQALKSFDEVLAGAAARGITVVVAAGDNGASDGATDGLPHVDFPASSPNVLAIGGTRISSAGGAISQEVTWNEGTFGTGGGVSETFPLPPWQAAAHVPQNHAGHAGRGLPDLAANASPSTGYRIRIHGQNTVIGGTAAATPFWAGLIAVLNQALGRKIGFLNPILYSTLGPAGALHDITEGNNSVGNVKGYSAGPGWDPVTGWGSPNGRALLKALQASIPK